MGQFESHERAAPALEVLFTIDQKQIDYCLHKLEELSKQRYQNQVSKWDLMSFLQLNQEQVGNLLRLLTSQQRATNVSIHLMMLALILCSEPPPAPQVSQKVTQTVSMISFMLTEGQIQKTEVSYILHLVDLWIGAVSSGSLLPPGTVSPASQEIEAYRRELEAKLFPDDNEDSTSVDSVCTYIASNPKSEQFMKMFDNQPGSGILSRKSIGRVGSSQDGSPIGRRTHQSFGKTPTASQFDRGSMSALSGRDMKSENKSTDMHIEVQNFPVREDASKEDVKSPKSKEKTGRVLSEKTGNQTINSPTGTDGVLSPNTQAMIHEIKNALDIDQELYWTTDAIQHVIQSYSTKMESMGYRIEDLSRLQEKLFEFRRGTNRIVESDRADNIYDLKVKIENIKNQQFEFYGKRQLSYMMRSFFFQQTLVNSGFSIKEYVADKLVSVRSSEDDLKDAEDDAQFERIMTRAYIGQAFREFYKQSLSMLKFELKQSNSRLLFYMSKRGEQRILEKKKYKALGELCSITQVLTIMDENRLKAENESAVMQSQSFMDKRASYGSHVTLARSEKQSQKSIPTNDQCFRLVYAEIQKLRSSKMSRRDIVKQMFTEELRKTQASQISFWEGVLSIMKQASQIRTFAELNFFKEFYEFADEHLVKDESLYRQTLLQRQSHKQAFLTYSSQIGKLKGLNLAISKSQEMSHNETAYRNTLLDRKKKLLSRLEKLDLQITVRLEHKTQKKRIAKSYFKTLGKISAHRIIVKGLPIPKIIDYLIIGSAKMRTQEVITLLSNQDRYSTNVTSVSQAHLLTSMQKIHTISTIDKAFNLNQQVKKTGTGASYSHQSQEESVVDTAAQYAKFQDELSTIVEMQRLMAEAPDHPVIENINQKETKKEMFSTVALMLTQCYTKSKFKIAQLKDFQTFVKQRHQAQGFSLQGSLTYKDWDVEDAGKGLFDYIDIESKKDQKTDDLIKWLGNLSCSLSNTYFHGAVEQLITHSQEAHVATQKFVKDLLHYNQMNYLNAIDDYRVNMLSDFVRCLKGANKGHFVNNLNSLYMSLPLEHSLENNYWLVQALQMQLNYYERKTKFDQLVQVHSPILLSKRSLSLNKKIAAQLILAAFNCGPQSVHASDKSDAEEDVFQKDFADFSKQFTMTKGENFLEFKVKRFLFAEVEEYLRVKTMQEKAVSAVRSQYLQEHGNGKYKDPKKNQIAVLTQELIDSVFELEGQTNLDELLPRYYQLKADFFEQLKSQAITGVISGAKNFLEKIIKLQQKENSFGQNQTLLKLQDYIIQMYNSVQVMKTTAAQARSGTNGPDNGAEPKKSRNENTISLSTVNSIGTSEVSYHTGRQGSDLKSVLSNASPTKKGKAAKGVKKKKKEENPLLIIESTIINMIARTQELYDMIFKARQSSSVDEFFMHLAEAQSVQMKIDKRFDTVQQYLKTNCDVTVPTLGKGERNSLQIQQGIVNQMKDLNLNCDQIGCTLIQEVQAGNIITPVFVFQPANAAQQGMPPQSMTKANDTKDFQASTVVGTPKQSSQLLNSQTMSPEPHVKFAPESIEASDVEASSVYEEDIEVKSHADDDGHQSQTNTLQVQNSNAYELSEQQKSINFILQFVNQVSMLDDKLTSKMILRSDALGVFIEQAGTQLSESQAQLQIITNIYENQQQLISVYNLQVTPVEHYLKNYQRTAKFVQREMIEAIQRIDEDHLPVLFNNVIARADPSLIKQVVGKMDSYYQNIDLDEPEKLDFQTAQVKIRRDFDQRLHTFKEYVDLEENKKTFQMHQSLTTHQLARINQEIAAMLIYIRIYYIKKTIE